MAEAAAQDGRDRTGPLKVAIGGYGAIGRRVAQALDRGIPGLELAAVSARDPAAARQRMAGELSRPRPVLPLGALARQADIVVECCPAAEFRSLAEPAIAAGRTLVVISSGALYANFDLVERARQTGARIVLPSGALLGLDAVRAAAEGEVHHVRMVTRKPPRGLVGAPHVAQSGLDLEALTEPLLLFRGSAAEAISGFPANLNVAVSLGLAGIGPERTELEIWASPEVTRNTHEIHVSSDSAELTLKIENVPSPENPKTGLITPLSVIAALRRLSAPLAVG